MNSWKTTLCGVLAIIGGGMTQFFADVPWLFKIGGFLATTAPAVGLLFARDNGVTSEQAGAKSSGLASSVKGPFIVLLAGLCASGVVSGCKSPYQAAGVVVVTADRAADAWADYYVWQQKQPGHDAAKLARQHAEVVAADLRYQAAMETVYFARKGFNANASGATNSVPVADVLRASQAASESLVRLILSFLPDERAATLKASP